MKTFRSRPSRTDSRGRSVHEHMIHQCVSENLWFMKMLGIDVGAPPLPTTETRLSFICRYAEDSTNRLTALQFERQSLVGNKHPVFRHHAVPRMGRDAADCAYLASPRPVNGHAPHAGARDSQQLRADRRYRRPDAEPRAYDLRLFQYGRTTCRRSPGRNESAITRNSRQAGAQRGRRNKSDGGCPSSLALAARPEHLPSVSESSHEHRAAFKVYLMSPEPAILSATKTSSHRSFCYFPGRIYGMRTSRHD